MWWSDGQINDDAFVKGIEYMIQKEIIHLPSAPNVSLSEDVLSDEIESQITDIPNWIRNVAQWWAEDTLNDVEFINGITWLVENEIIEIV